MVNCFEQPTRLRKGITVGSDELLGFGEGAHFEGGFDQHSQTASAAHKQFAEIVPRNVLDHFAPIMNQPSIGQDNFDSKQMFPDGPVPESPWAAGVAIDD